jgi:putative flippase GtrA
MQMPEPKSKAPQQPIDYRRIAGEFLRFLLMGGMNTLVAYLIYLILLNWIRYEVAYAIGYATGIVIAYWVSAAFVFRKPMRGRSAIRFPLVYVTQFLVSGGILHVAVEIMHVPHWLAFIVAVGLTIPVTFALSRWVLHAG